MRLIVNSKLKPNNKSMEWYTKRLIRLYNDKGLTMCIDTSNTIYPSPNLANIIRTHRGRYDTIIHNKEGAKILLTTDNESINRFKGGKLPKSNPAYIRVDDISISLEDPNLLDSLNLLDEIPELSETLEHKDCELESDPLKVISQVTGLSTYDIQNVVSALFGVASVLVMEQMNEECEDPIIDLAGLCTVSVEDNQPIILKGHYQVDKLQNLKLCADDMLCNMIKRRNSDRVKEYTELGGALDE